MSADSELKNIDIDDDMPEDGDIEETINEISKKPDVGKDESIKDCVEYIKKPKITDLKCGRGGD